MNSLTKLIPPSITSKVARQVLVSQKHSPTILFVGGVVGVIATTVMASKATLRVSEVLEESKTNLQQAKDLHESGHKDYSEDDYKKDVVYIYSRVIVEITKLYGPTILVGVASIAALTKSHNILNNRISGLTAAYAVLDKTFNEYRRRVVDTYGEEADRKFRYASEERVAVRAKDGTETKVIRVSPEGPSGYARFFDQFSNSWSKEPEYNLVFLRCQQNYANDMLRARGHIFLNEVYDMLGIERSRAGAVVGWVIGNDGDNYIDFGVFDGENPRARDFVNGREGAILLDFNIDGVIYDKI